VGKLQVKRPIGKPSCKWVDNIKMNLRVIGWDGIKWIELAQNRDQWTVLMSTVIKFQVP
jgi:hypothetical protein